MSTYAGWGECGEDIMINLAFKSNQQNFLNIFFKSKTPPPKKKVP